MRTRENYTISSHALGPFYKKNFLTNIDCSLGHFYKKKLFACCSLGECYKKNFSQLQKKISSQL